MTRIVERIHVGANVKEDSVILVDHVLRLMRRDKKPGEVEALSSPLLTVKQRPNAEALKCCGFAFLTFHQFRGRQAPLTLAVARKKRNEKTHLNRSSKISTHGKNVAFHSLCVHT